MYNKYLKVLNRPQLNIYARLIGAILFLPMALISKYLFFNNSYIMVHKICGTDI
jgi:hypothetical protein